MTAWSIVLSGDVPLTQARTLHDLVQAAGGSRMALLTVTLDNPTGYGRIVRNAQGTVQRIVEHKDASDAERAITEVYSGIMAVPAKRLAQLAGATEQPQRPGRVLPDRHRRHGRGRWRGRGGRTASPTRCRWRA